MFSDKLIRIDSFKAQLKHYLESLLRSKQKTAPKRLNLDLILKLKGVCSILNNKQLRLEGALLYFQTVHRKLSQPGLHKKP